MSGFKLFLLVVLGIIVLLLIGLGTSWFGLVTERPMAKYQEETRAQTYDKSRQYNQGTNRDIARYCLQMREAKEPSAKKAVASMIRSTASTFDGTLNSDNIDCVNEAKGY